MSAELKTNLKIIKRKTVFEKYQIKRSKLSAAVAIHERNYHVRFSLQTV